MGNESCITCHYNFFFFLNETLTLVLLCIHVNHVEDLFPLSFSQSDTNNFVEPRFFRPQWFLTTISLSDYQCNKQIYCQYGHERPI